MLCCAEAQGAIRTETIEYRHGDVSLEGYVAYDDGRKGKLPGVIIVHEWTGIGPYVKKRAEMVASLGYAAFCIDIYGRGIRPKDMKEAAQQATLYRENRGLMRARAKAGLNEMCRFDFVDTEKRWSRRWNQYMKSAKDWVGDHLRFKGSVFPQSH